MKNKGFTLIELITVIALLAIISLIIFPIIINKIDKGKENAYNVQINSIKKAAENFALKNISSIPQNSGDTLTLKDHVITKGEPVISSDIFFDLLFDAFFVDSPNL